MSLEDRLARAGASARQAVADLPLDVPSSRAAIRLPWQGRRAQVVLIAAVAAVFVALVGLVAGPLTRSHPHAEPATPGDPGYHGFVDGMNHRVSLVADLPPGWAPAPLPDYHVDLRSADGRTGLAVESYPLQLQQMSTHGPARSPRGLHRLAERIAAQAGAPATVTPARLDGGPAWVVSMAAVPTRALTKDNWPRLPNPGDPSRSCIPRHPCNPLLVSGFGHHATGPLTEGPTRLWLGRLDGVPVVVWAWTTAPGPGPDAELDQLVGSLRAAPAGTTG